MPKTSLPAAAEGLPTIHRRSVLKGVLATGLAGGTCRVKAAPTEPSPELAHLIASERAARFNLDASTERLNALFTRFETWKYRSKSLTFESRIGIFINPARTTRSEGIAGLMDARRAAAERVENALPFGRALTAAIEALEADLAADCAALNAIYDRIDRRRATLGVDMANRDHDDAGEAWCATRRAVLEFPTRIPADIEAKAEWLRIAAGEDGKDFGPEDGRALLASFTSTGMSTTRRE